MVGSEAPSMGRAWHCTSGPMTREVTVPEEDSSTDVFLDGHAIKLPSKYFYFTHRLVRLLALVRSLSSIGQHSKQRFIANQSTENKRLLESCSKWDLSITPSGAQGASQKRG